MDRHGAGFIEMLKHLADMFGIRHSLDERGVREKVETHRIDADYPFFVYTDERGRPLYKIERYLPIGDGKKEFHPYEYIGDTETYSTKSGLTRSRVVYNLPAVNAAIESGEVIFFVEGEKCAEILKAEGLTATCVSNGANGWKNEHGRGYARSFYNAHVVILPDNDVNGKNFAKTVAESILGVAKEVKIMSLNGAGGITLGPKHDVEQWLKLGGTKDKLTELANKEHVYTNETEGNEFFDDDIIVSKGGKYRRNSDKGGSVPITNFTITPYAGISNGDDFWLSVKVKKAGFNAPTYDKKIPMKAFARSEDFKKLFSEHDLMFTGSANDLQYIKVMTSQIEYPVIKGVDYVGVHMHDGKYVYVDKNGAWGSDGGAINDIILAPWANSGIKSELFSAEVISKDELTAILPDLFKYNTIDKTASIMGFMAASLFKAQLKELEIKFPYLFLFGLTRGGKSTTTDNIIMPFYGVNSAVSAGDASKFATSQANTTSNVIPLIIEEHTYDIMDDNSKKNIRKMLHNNYDGNAAIRGNADKSVTEFEYIRPIIMNGETTIDDRAIRDRAIELSFGEIDITPDMREHFFALTARKGLMTKLAKALLLAALDTSATTVGTLFTKIGAKIPPEFTSRVANNVAVCVLGLCFFERLLKNHGLTLEERAGITMKELVDAVIGGMNERINVDGAKDNIIDKTIKTFERMAAKGILIKGLDYTFRNSTVRLPGRQVAINMHSAYDKYTDYLKEIGQEKDKISLDLYSSQIKKTGYWADYNKGDFWLNAEQRDKKPKDMTSQRVYWLGTQKLAEILDVNVLAEQVYTDAELPKEFK